jgi:hypothetical protein
MRRLPNQVDRAIYHSCGGKEPIRSQHEADLLARELSQNGEVLLTYLCQWRPPGTAAHWHVGHRSGTKPRFYGEDPGIDGRIGRIRGKLRSILGTPPKRRNPAQLQYVEDVAFLLDVLEHYSEREAA